MLPEVFEIWKREINTAFSNPIKGNVLHKMPLNENLRIRSIFRNLLLLFQFIIWIGKVGISINTLSSRKSITGIKASILVGLWSMLLREKCVPTSFKRSVWHISILQVVYESNVKNSDFKIWKMIYSTTYSLWQKNKSNVFTVITV